MSKVKEVWTERGADFEVGKNIQDIIASLDTYSVRREWARRDCESAWFGDAKGAKILRRAHLARRSCGGAAAVTRRFNFLNSADRVLEWTYPHQNSEGCTHRLVVCNDHRVGVNASTYLEINAKKENLDAAVSMAYRQVVHIGAVSYPGHAQYLGTVLAPLAAQRPRTLQKYSCGATRRSAQQRRVSASSPFSLLEQPGDPRAS
ncbi:hypothetical protein C8F04DRAFT_1191807 [Mycena alexandri]|uniref:Uncharacterized protein n=1 Tax=Mycena alexandri TaxID=1745969 RepID=A0AAD6SC39_9AGAR|nr:hypothetical protein C8F04DRAFT_1191807 [Mycena alexandri]